ncbi:MAG: type IX secretion system protein PorQ [Saprospiraceae bacterium]|nr:type IX secretion system protein PorQ [Saprospiraceae bacterium]
MDNRLLHILILILLPLPALLAQIGGKHHYEFLNIPNSARITALGGYLNTVKDDDVTLALTNPAALNPEMGGALAFHHNFFISDIQNGYFGYGHQLKESDYTLHAAIKYITYGDFQETNDMGDITGEFDANEIAIVVGAGRSLNENYSVGVNLKHISSRFEAFTSSAIAGDVSAMYYNPDKEWAITISLTNFGWVYEDYTDNTEASMPTQLQIGFSKRLEHLPFRYSIIAHHLEEWNIAYDDPAAQDGTILFGEDPSSDEGPSFIDQLARHFVFNGEFLFGEEENFRIRLGYNNLRRADLNLVNQFTLSGFTFGVGFKVNRFKVDYGFGGYHFASNAHHFSISTNIKSFRSKLDEI